jgi:hypothetical protein
MKFLLIIISCCLVEYGFRYSICYRLKLNNKLYIGITEAVFETSSCVNEVIWLHICILINNAKIAAYEL